MTTLQKKVETMKVDAYANEDQELCHQPPSSHTTAIKLSNTEKKSTSTSSGAIVMNVDNVGIPTKEFVEDNCSQESNNTSNTAGSGEENKGIEENENLYGNLSKKRTATELYVESEVDTSKESTDTPRKLSRTISDNITQMESDKNEEDISLLRHQSFTAVELSKRNEVDKKYSSDIREKKLEELQDSQVHHYEVDREIQQEKKNNIKSIEKRETETKEKEKNLESVEEKIGHTNEKTDEKNNKGSGKDLETQKSETLTFAENSNKKSDSKIEGNESNESSKAYLGRSPFGSKTSIGKNTRIFGSGYTTKIFGSSQSQNHVSFITNKSRRGKKYTKYIFSFYRNQQDFPPHL